MQQLNFKNDDDRRRFLIERNESEGWYIWKEDHDLNRRWVRVDLEAFSIIVEEENSQTGGERSRRVSSGTYTVVSGESSHLRTIARISPRS